MQFTIITPTYKRPDALSKCIDSVMGQNYNEKNIQWRMVIINDSPDYNYADIENKIHINTNIVYIKNQNNMGVNYSRNTGLDYISQHPFGIPEKSTVNENEYIIFLDDDDWLAPDALKNINDILENNHNKENIKWLMTNRSLPDSTSLSHIRKKHIEDFNAEFLLLRRSGGDVTHAIERTLALSSRFSKKVKQGEEWLYFSQLQSSVHYENINTTISDGYAKDGLNRYMSVQEKKQKIKNIFKLFTEVKRNKITIYLYLKLRLLKTLFS